MFRLNNEKLVPINIYVTEDEYLALTRCAKVQQLTNVAELIEFLVTSSFTPILQFESEDLNLRRN